MYYYEYSYDYTPGFMGGILAALGAWIFILSAIGLLIIIAKWVIYEKAGRKGWESIIPIYNLVVAFEFLDIPMWMIILLFIPGANVAVPIVMAIKMAERFGKPSGYAVGLIFLPYVFYPMLAFGKAEFK